MSRANPLILSVDDEPANLALIRKLVTRLGYQLIEASNGEGALKAVAEHEPDVILLDVMMPDLNGFEVCRKIRAQPKFSGLPILLLTSLTATEDKAVGLEAGANDFLAKPFEEVELIARLRSLLRTKALQDRLADVLGRYVSESVAHRVLQDPSGAMRLGGDRRTITALMADLRGYTSLADSKPAEVLLALLNRYMSVATDIIFAREGTIADLLGDGIFAFFGAPVIHADDARRAVAAALDLQAAVSAMSLPELPGVRLQTGIAVTTGEAIAGNIGSERRMHYTVIGDPVNIAARLLVAAGPGQILIDETTHSVVRDFVVSEDMGPMRVASKGETVHVFKIVGIRPSVPA